MANVKTMKVQQTETEVAILQVQVKNIEEKVGEIKDDVKGLQDSLEKHSKEHTDMIQTMQAASANAHKALSEKITALEKWRWMMMGAGIVIGSLGFETLAKLLR